METYYNFNYITRYHVLRHDVDMWISRRGWKDRARWKVSGREISGLALTLKSSLSAAESVELHCQAAKEIFSIWVKSLYSCYRAYCVVIHITNFHKYCEINSIDIFRPMFYCLYLCALILFSRKYVYHPECYIVDEFDAIFLI